MLWAIFVAVPSSPYYLPCIALLVAMPWLALAVAGLAPDHFSLIGQRDDHRPQIDGAFLMPGFVLMLRLITDVHLTQWDTIHLPAIAATLLLGFLALKLSPHMRQSKAVIFCLFTLTLPYGYSAAVMTNAIADTHGPHVFQTVVKEKYVSRGTKSSLPELVIGPWGPEAQDTRDLPVSRDVFRKLNKGDIACINLMPGFLGIEWYNVKPCSP